MEKILLIIDPRNISMHALDFACFLGRLTKSKVTGVFLENQVADEKPVLKSLAGTAYLDWESDATSDEYLEKQRIIDTSIQRFKEACENRSVRYSIHRDRGVPAKEVVAESRFADIIVTDATSSFNKTFEGTPTEFVKDLLKDSECPVIIAPESFEAIDEIVFTCDGSSSSVFAMKQFTYLFPELSDKKVTALQVNKSGHWEDIDKYNMREWLKDHYSSIGFEALEGDTDDRLFDYLFKRKNVLVVMGAYGRSSLSRFFKHSEADFLINILTQPIFIAHH
jgi:hypothetical protein